MIHPIRRIVCFSFLSGEKHCINIKNCLWRIEYKKGMSHYALPDELSRNDQDDI